MATFHQKLIKTMKIIASTGGKGGVGKSLFAAGLAYSLYSKNKKVLLVDLDIECPNLHIIFNVKLKNKKKIFTEIPRLIKKNCKKCGVCSKFCKENAIFWRKGEYPIFFENLCSGCGICWNVCEFNAIKPKKKLAGFSYFTKIKKHFWLFSGESLTKIRETAIIVRETKKRAFKFAKKKNVDYVIIDTPPGIHCNTIHSLIDCDEIFLVTEPTLVGAHDLKIMIELLKKMNKKYKIVLNKFGVGDPSLIQKISKKFKVEIVLKIPYSKEIFNAYVNSDVKRISEFIKVEV